MPNMAASHALLCTDRRASLYHSRCRIRFGSIYQATFELVEGSLPIIYNHLFIVFDFPFARLLTVCRAHLMRHELCQRFG